MVKDIMIQFLENYKLNPEEYHAEIFQRVKVRIVHWDTGLQATGETNETSYVANFKEAYQNMVQLMLDTQGKLLNTLP